MASFEITIPRAVEWLDRHPDGCDATDLAAALGVSYSHAAGAMIEACERGLIRWVHAPFGRANNRRVYFVPRHCPAVWGEASRKPVAKKASGSWRDKAMARVDAQATEAQRAAGFSSTGPGLAAAAGKARGPVVTVAPPFVDRRWEPAGVVPRVVDPSQCRPWAAAATGAA